MPKISERSRLEQAKERKAQLEKFQEELGNLVRLQKKEHTQTELIARFKGSVTVNARALSVFLDLFTIAYNVSFVVFNYAKESHEHLEMTANVIHQALTEVSGLEDKGQFVELEIERISFQTRLEITFVGASIPLALAVILSGGSMDIEPAAIKATMPAIGKAGVNLGYVFEEG